MQSCARLGKIIEEAIKRCHKIQFFSWSSIKFFLNVHDFRVREMCKIHSSWYVFSYEFIGVFNAPFLPVGMRCISSILLIMFGIVFAVYLLYFLLTGLCYLYMIRM